MVQSADVPRAVAAARSIAAALGLPADEAVVLNHSNKLTLRLLPCDVLARVAPVADRVAQFEIDVAQRLAGGPVAALAPGAEPRVHERDGFTVTLWTYYEPTTAREIPPAVYAGALTRLHAGMRAVTLPTPHFTDRVEQALRIVTSPGLSPALAAADRELLAATLRDQSRAIGEHGAPEQLLHGEPHPGNLLATAHGPLFIDFETCCRGPVEFDVAHAPDEVAEHYPGLDPELLGRCRTLMLAIITAWRWDRDDQLPDGRRLGELWLAQLRAGAAHGQGGGSGPASTA